MQAEGEVLEPGQEAVADVLPARHAARQRVAQEATAQHEVLLAGEDRRDQCRDPCRVVLVVRVEHDDDLGAGRKGGVVARLLVAAVALVLAVDDDVEAQLPRHVDRFVMRDVVDQDDLVDELVRDVGVGPLERLCGVVGGHDDDDPGRFGRVRRGGSGHGRPGRFAW